MHQEDVLTFHPLKEEDIEPLTRIMKRAFDEDTRIHLGRKSGGPPGYEEFCKILKSPKNKEHASTVAWSNGLQPTGKKFDPAWFDADMVNVTLYWYNRWSRPRKLD